jgi:hypothetical protein
VVAGDHYSNGCCFNYGNARTNGLSVGTGTMESVYFGTSTVWGSGSGTGSWIMSDLEAGLFSGYNARVNNANPTINWRFVTGVFGGGGRNFWELKGGNAQEGGFQPARGPLTCCLTQKTESPASRSGEGRPRSGQRRCLVCLALSKSCFQ